MKLTDTQLIILGEASSRDDGIVILPDRLKGGAATAVVDKLLRAKLIEEIKATAKMPIWPRDEAEGVAYALHITADGLAAIGSSDDMAGNRPVQPKKRPRLAPNTPTQDTKTATPSPAKTTLKQARGALNPRSGRRRKPLLALGSAAPAPARSRRKSSPCSSRRRV